MNQQDTPLSNAASLYGEWNGPAILLVDLDAFFASVEQLDHPAWRDKPVIVGGDADKHGVVSTCSYEARKFGVRSAMPASMAERLCPHAIWTHGHFDRYREMSAQVMAILHDETPYVQQVSIDEAFLDVSPTSVNTEHPVCVAQRIQVRVAQLGVTCSIGVGTSKTIAKVASDMDKPRGLTVVYPGREIEFLSPLPVRSMSGVGARAEETLKKHGISTLGQMAQAPERLLQSIWGKNADMMRRRCLGLDVSPVQEDDEVKSVSNEITLSKDLKTFEDIAATVDTMAAKVARRLRRKGLAGHTLTLKIRFSDRATRSVQRRLDQQLNNEHVFIPLLHEMIREVWKPGMAVRLVGVGVTGFVEDEFKQESLFDAALFTEPTHDAPQSQDDQFSMDLGSGDVEEMMGRGTTETPKPDKAYRIGAQQGEKLSSATDKVKDRFGEMAVFFGRELQVKEKTTGTGAKNPEDYLK